MRPSRKRRRARSSAEGSGVTLGQLRVFGVVAEGEHLTRASKTLRMSQGSVSAQVRRLESALGLPLLDRVGRNVRLTDFGRSLRPLAREVVEKAREIDELAYRFHQREEGLVSIATGAVIGAHRIGSWLSPFVQAHPRIDVHIQIAAVQNAVDAVVKGEIDVAIVGTAVSAQAVETIGLEVTDLIIVAGRDHPLASSAAPLESLDRYRYLVHGHGSATQLHAERVLGELIDGAQRVELGEEAMLGALHAGIGFAAMPRAIVEADIASGRLVMIPFPDRDATVVFTAVRRRPPHTPAAEAFWGHLRSLAGE